MRLSFWRERKEIKRIAESPGHELDRELAERIGKGDRAALALLLDRHLGAVYGYLARRLGPGLEQTAAEVTRATFEHALRHIRPYARGAASVPMQLWLIREAGRQLARRRKNMESAPPSEDTTPQFANLRRLLNTLPPRKAAILSLALLEGMSAQDIARASGVSLPRAMRLLRAALKRAGASMNSESIKGSQHG